MTGTTSRGFTKEQLYSTASYLRKDLSSVGLGSNDLSGWDFGGFNLTRTSFNGSTLLNTNFADAIVDRGIFDRATPRGFSYEQLASTATFQQRNLVGMSFSENDLTGWNFSVQNLRQSQISQSNLTRANFSDADLTNVSFVLSSGIDTADFSDAIVNGAHFALTTLTKEQLYTTASYKQKDLSRTILQSMDLTAGDLSGQNLSSANLGGARLTGADFTGAIIQGVAINTTSGNFTAAQLYSTASHQQKNLKGIALSGDLSGWDFSGQNLIQSNLGETVLTNANFSEADVRSGTGLPSSPTTILRNTIRPDGRIRGLELTGTESLLVRDFELAINVTQGFAMSQQGTLNLQLADASWGSKITFTPSLIPDLGGVLELSFAASADLATPGAVFDLFDWPSPLDAANRFDRIEVPTGSEWDLTQLYTTGEVRLLAIPEPASIALFAIALIPLFILRRSRRLVRTLALSLAALLLFSHTPSLRAAIFRWDNQALIPGTALIIPGPGVQLDHRDLDFANLSNVNLTRANFNSSNLSNALFERSDLGSADFSEAQIGGANFSFTTLRGLTAAQIYSTASYRDKNLTSVRFPNNDLTGWNFRGVNLSGASFLETRLTGVDLTDAEIAGSSSPARSTTLTGTTSRGFTKEQLSSTASYRRKDLSFVVLGNNDLSGWNFGGFNLTRTSFSGSTLLNTNFANAIIDRGTFSRTTPGGFTHEQLASTANFQQSNLVAMHFSENDLTRWNFSGQNLTFTSFEQSNLTNVIFSGANLTSTHFAHSFGIDTADFSDAIINGAGFTLTTFTKEQLYTTASYKQKDLSRINFGAVDFRGVDLTSQNFFNTNLSLTNLSASDLRRATEIVLTGAVLRNAILPDGSIPGLELRNTERLVVRDVDLAINVSTGFSMADQGTLDLQFADASWGSKITFTPSLTPDLGGVLALSFAPSADLAAMPGTVFDLFDWPAPLNAANRFDRIDTPAGSEWDLSNLYTTGEVRILAIPEPSSFALTAVCALALCIIWRTKRKGSVATAVACLLAVLCPATLLAESITVEQGNQVVRSGNITVNATEQITVRDPGSKLEIQDFLTFVSGILRVESSGTLSTNTGGTSQSRLSGDGARAFVVGPGSMWTVAGPLSIGDLYEGHLTISNGGIVESGLRGSWSRVIGGLGDRAAAASTATVEGSGSKWIVHANLEIGDSGESHLFIRDGGHVTSGLNGDRTRIVAAGLERGEPPSTATVIGVGSAWDIHGDFSVASFGNASLKILNGGRVTSGIGGRTDLGGSATRPGSATVEGANSIWTIEGAFQMGVGDVPATMRVANGGLLSVGTTFFGGTRSVLELAGGSVEAAEIVMNGEIRGGGMIVADLTSQSRLAVGNSAGQLSIGGDFTQLAGASLAMELAGRGGVPGIDFDQLVVRDAALLRGRIDVTLLNNFAPAKGDSFNLIRYGSLQFATPGVPPPLNLPSLTGDLLWSSNFGPQALTITVVPEPSTWILAAFALVGFLASSWYAILRRRSLWCGRSVSLILIGLPSVLSMATAANGQTLRAGSRYQRTNRTVVSHSAAGRHESSIHCRKGACRSISEWNWHDSRI